ncbi:MAG: ammonium transporter, partial [Chloroflexota bacterium]
MEVNLLIDNLWIILSALLVFLMQAGFLSLEAGLTRSKNSINVAIKNISDFFLTGFLYFLVGYGIMYGETISGVLGSTRFLPEFSSFSEQAYFFFQVMFAATTVTIISGAIAERVRFSAYLIIAVIVSVIIYPVVGHWVWAGTYLDGGQGWLAAIGFYDFAGGTVVHSLGGWIALAILILIGPRAGRYGEDGTVNQIHGSNLVLSSLGALLLIFGWFGFNGGSLYAFNEATMNILIVTLLGASSGVSTVIVYSLLTKSHFSASNLINGILVGLVAVTPGASVISFEAAILISVISVFLMLGSVAALDRFQIDDAVGAVPVHLVGGVWGTIAVAIFGDPLLIGSGLSFQEQLIVQCLGVIVCAAWGFIPSLAIFYLIDRLSPLRVTLEEEVIGLNISEHDASTDLVSFLSLLDFQVRSGDTSARAPVEPFTEVGQIAERYNTVMDNLEEKQVQLTTILANAPIALFSTNIYGKITVVEGTFFDQLNIAINHSLYALFERDEDSKQNILQVLEGKNRDWVTQIGDRYISFRCQPKKNEIGKIDGLTGVASDITQQRTSDVSREKYIDMLSTSAEISEQVTTILDKNELVETILPLLQVKYNLYHAAVLLLDESGTKLNFAFGSDTRAKRLMESRESILVDHPHSIIARAARRKRVVIVNDVSVEPNFFPHPLLTETKSELAVPLMVHNELIGILDIQENRVRRFEETDVDLFVTIGRQLAIAFNNAILFEKFQKSEVKLKGALEQAVQSDKAKDDFLARVSHELRTPLGVILGYAEMLQ